MHSLAANSTWFKSVKWWSVFQTPARVINALTIKEFGTQKSYTLPVHTNTEYSMLPSIPTVPVSGHLKQKLDFWGALFSSRKTKYFEWKLNISALRRKFWRFESLRNSRGRRRSVQVSKLLMANIYAVYCAVKLVLLRKGMAMWDIFKETVLFLKWRYLRKSGFQKVY